MDTRQQAGLGTNLTKLSPPSGEMFQHLTDFWQSFPRVYFERRPGPCPVFSSLRCCSSSISLNHLPWSSVEPSNHSYFLVPVRPVRPGLPFFYSDQIKSPVWLSLCGPGWPGRTVPCAISHFSLLSSENSEFSLIIADLLHPPSRPLGQPAWQSGQSLGRVRLFGVDCWSIRSICIHQGGISISFIQ